MGKLKEGYRALKRDVQRAFDPEVKMQRLRDQAAREEKVQARLNEEMQLRKKIAKTN